MATPKCGQKVQEKLFCNQPNETNTKMGGRSLLTNFEFIGSPLGYPEHDGRRTEDGNPSLFISLSVLKVNIALKYNTLISH